MKHLNNKLNKFFLVFLTLLMVIQSSCVQTPPLVQTKSNINSSKMLPKLSFKTKVASNGCVNVSTNWSYSPAFSLSGTSLNIKQIQTGYNDTTTMNFTGSTLGVSMPKGGTVSFSATGTIESGFGDNFFSCSGTRNGTASGTITEANGLITLNATSVHGDATIAHCSSMYNGNSTQQWAAADFSPFQVAVFSNYPTIDITADINSFTVTPTDNTLPWTATIAGPPPSDSCPNVPKYQKEYTGIGTKTFPLSENGKFLPNGLYAIGAIYNQCSDDSSLTAVELNNTGILSITAEPNPFIIANGVTSIMNFKVTSNSLEPWNLTFNGPEFNADSGKCQTKDQTIPWTVPVNGQGNYTANVTYVDGGSSKDLAVAVYAVAPTPGPTINPTPTVTPSVDPSVSPSNTPSPSPTDITIPTPTPVPTSTSNPVPTPTPTSTPTATPIPSPPNSCNSEQTTFSTKGVPKLSPVQIAFEILRQEELIKILKIQ